MNNHYMEKPKIGKYILDSLSIGMYNHPLMLIREYIQNSVDAIDYCVHSKMIESTQGKVDIAIEWRSKTLVISDNGCGIPADKAYSMLNDLGRSLKKSNKDRGFRGIGRLGGLGYCDRLTFKTKFKGDKRYSLSTWDCVKLRKIINEEDNNLDIFSVIEEVTSFEQSVYEGNSEDHFFIVEMVNVKSSRDLLLNVPEIKSYLSQVAPVPFDHNKFSFADKIDNTLRSIVPKYETYYITVNGEQILKPYVNEVFISDKHKDSIQDVEFIKFKQDDNFLAIAWVAKLKLLGVIRSSSLVDCLRIRSGNILIGDKYLLSDFFRERRFNNYIIGEIHTIDRKLNPNSRRDDFEDNSSKESFLSCFIKDVGLTFSSLIRRESVKRTLDKKDESQSRLIEHAKQIAKKGYYSENQKKKLLEELGSINNAENNEKNSDLGQVVNGVKESKHFVFNLNGSLSSQKKKMLKVIINDIFETCTNKIEADKIISKIVRSFEKL